MKVLIIDLYDSFTYNIRQYLKYAGGCQVGICSYHQIQEIDFHDYNGIILSPGPGLPDEYPLLNSFISHYDGKRPVLGICLGHQAIALHYGAKLKQLSQPMHGKSSFIYVNHLHSVLYHGIKEKFLAGRYHSWYVSEENLPDCLQITAVLKSGIIMGLKHKQYPVEGIQFHPESIITKKGVMIFRNWLNSVKDQL